MLCAYGLVPAISGTSTDGVVMIDKNPQARALAFKKCKGKLLKIKELAITPDLSEEDIDTLIENLAVAKAEAKGTTDMSEYVTGQRWYVEGLVKFSGMSTEEQFQAEYDDSFADTASEVEMLKALSEIAA
jgi:hypothetical protein